MPKPNARTTNTVLSTKDTTKFGVLTRFNLSHQFTEHRTVSGSIFTRDSDLLRTLTHSFAAVVLVVLVLLVYVTGFLSVQGYYEENIFPCFVKREERQVKMYKREKR